MSTSTEFLSQSIYYNGRMSYCKLIFFYISLNRWSEVEKSVFENEQPKPQTFTRIPVDGGPGSTKSPVSERMSRKQTL